MPTPDRSPAVAPLLVRARIGRTDLGSVALSFEDDALIVVVRDQSGERTARLSLASIQAVFDEDGDVVMPLRNGTRLILTGDAPSELCDLIRGRCMALPELTRALRALGSRRGAHGVRASAGDEQRRFFAPLLDARRLAASSASPSNTVAAFGADALIAATHRVVQSFAAERISEHGPARRALEAELADAIEPLEDALRRMRDAADRASEVRPELAPWRAWAAELQVTFEMADRVWLAVDQVLEVRPIPIAGRTK